ncbi:MAG TPA: FGGY family carbohydrate kinase [Spirochaetia bacterium]|nr:FGGY family carbohydrate kinase [Spirochaetia bacterium]
MDCLAAIDIGSTSTKAFLFDLSGRVVSQASTPMNVEHTDEANPSWAFWHPEKVWESVCAVMRAASCPPALAPPDEATVLGVAVTGLGMDGLPVDSDGEWLYPFISWHCTRTEPQSRRWSERIGRKRLFELSGKQVQPFDTVYRLLWMQEFRPEILRRADRWLLIEDWVNFKLCGSRATDFSMASTTSLFDQRKRGWSDELVEAAGVKVRLLPDVAPSGTRIGTVTPAASRVTALRAGTPVFLGGHDYLCAALAAGAFQPGVVLDITGTWELVVRAVDRPLLSEEAFDAGLTVESHVANGMYCTTGFAVSADMTEWYRREFCYEERERAAIAGCTDWQCIMDGPAEAPVGADGVFFLPHFSGAGTPVNDSRSLGAFVGLHNGVTKACLARAMFEGLNYQSRKLIDAVVSSAGGPVPRIVVTGGAARNSFWMQNKADIIGRPIDVSDTEEATALGAAILAGIGAGVYSSESDAYEKTCADVRTVEPDQGAAEQYARYNHIFESLYPALRGVNESIYRNFRLRE